MRTHSLFGLVLVASVNACVLHGAAVPAYPVRPVVTAPVAAPVAQEAGASFHAGPGGAGVGLNVAGFGMNVQGSRGNSSATLHAPGAAVVARDGRVVVQ